MTEVELRRAREMENGLAYVEQLVGQNDLPTADIRDGDGTFFLAVRDGNRVGCGGLETDGRDGLLRSVVVERDARGDGIGRVVCDRLCATARDRGVSRLFLLTTTATGFFESQGFDRIDRTAVPQSIRETCEFADLCPETAVVMRRRLD